MHLRYTMKRSAGILLHVTSLPSPYGIGTLGKEAYAFVDFLKKAGQTWWQVLPIGPTGYGDSPYQPFSAFAGNPYLIDLELLCEEGLLKKEELAGVNFGASPRHVDYGKQYENRYPLLRKAFARAPRAELMIFAAQQPRIADYALFMALKDHFDGAPYYLWEKPIRLRQPAAMEKYRRALADDILFYVFLQYKFFEQFRALKEYANENDVKLIGDVPIYLPADCADVWAEPELFMLDKDLLPVEVAGVPPDYFSEEGQLWGNPLYDWQRHAENGLCLVEGAHGRSLHPV